MTADVSPQVDASTSPGALLKAEREKQGLGEREVADRLNLMPGYVDILERNDYQALRSPAFARGYVKAYGRLLELEEEQLLQLFDEQRQAVGEARKRVTTRSLQLQHTGVGVGIGLGVLLVLVLALWWWQDGGFNEQAAPQPAAVPEVVGDLTPAGES